MLRSHDGSKTYLIATDLSVHLTRHDWDRAIQAGSKSIVVWESTDLIKWSEPRLVRVAPDDAGCTWAPEAIHDRRNGDYLVFWASRTGSDDFGKHRIWAARTKDFREFSKPFVYIEKERGIIDTTIVFEDGRYYRFSKDEDTKAITMESSPELDGEWKDVDGFSLKHLRGFEGPACYRIKSTDEGDGTWCLLLDFYRESKGYQPYLTKDLASGEFSRAEGMSFPFHFRHGSVLAVSEDEYQRLEESLDR